MRLLTGNPALADQIADDYRQAALEARERAMLDWAVKVTHNHDECTDDDIGALRAAGWTDEDIFDMTETAAMLNLTNRLANALGWVPNDEYPGLGR